MKKLFYCIVSLTIIACSGLETKTNLETDDSDTIRRKFIESSVENDKSKVAEIGIQIYDQNNVAHPDCKTIDQYKNKLGVELESIIYDSSGEFIVELYKKGTGEFVGFVADTSKIKWQSLRYYKQRKSYNVLISKYNLPYADWIYQKRAWVGMSKEQLIDSWGKPEKVNTTLTKERRYEQWIYKNNKYVNLENDFVTIIQK